MIRVALKQFIRDRLRRSRVLNYLPRVLKATRYYNRKYREIVIWGFESRESTNYTYAITDDNLMSLACTIALATKMTYQQVMRHIQEVENDEELKTHVINTSRTSSLRWVSDPRCEFGRRLGWYAVVRAIKPKTVIETGVDKGLGTVLLCSALLRNQDEGFPGRYYGTDNNRNAGSLLFGKYSQIGEILYGDSIETLKRFDGAIDVFINDSEHSAAYEYGEYLAILNKLRRGSIILSDNSHATAKLAQFSIENHRNFLFFHEVPKKHWYPGGGIGISF